MTNSKITENIPVVLEGCEYYIINGCCLVPDKNKPEFAYVFDTYLSPRECNINVMYGMDAPKLVHYSRLFQYLADCYFLPGLHYINFTDKDFKRLGIADSLKNFGCLRQIEKRSCSRFELSQVTYFVCFEYLRELFFVRSNFSMIMEFIYEHTDCLRASSRDKRKRPHGKRTIGPNRLFQT